jgi:hypothetical protein
MKADKKVSKSNALAVVGLIALKIFVRRKIGVGGQI